MSKTTTYKKDFPKKWVIPNSQPYVNLDKIPMPNVDMNTNYKNSYPGVQG